MRYRIVQKLLLAVAMFLVSVSPVAAQTDAFSAGLSSLRNLGGVGVNVDYSRTLMSHRNGRTMGWVGDFSFSRDQDLDDDIVLVDGGVRLAGQAGGRMNWHIQGTAGVVRESSFGGTRFLAMPGGAFTYWLSKRSGVKAQLGVPLILSGETGMSVRFDVNYVRKLGR